MLWAKFRWNWNSRSGEYFENCQFVFLYYWYVPLGKDMSLHLIKLKCPLQKDLLCQNTCKIELASRSCWTKGFVRFVNKQSSDFRPLWYSFESAVWRCLFTWTVWQVLYEMHRKISFSAYIELTITFCHVGFWVSIYNDTFKEKNPINYVKRYIYQYFIHSMSF